MREPSAASDLDAIRGHVESRSVESQERAFRAGLAPESAAFLDAYRLVDGVLGPEPASGHASTTTLAAMERRLDANDAAPRPARLRPRLVAAAACLVAAAFLAGMLTARAPEPETVRLTSTADVPEPSEPGHAARAALACAERMRDYAPLRDGDVAWFTSIADARTVAGVTGRPVLLFLSHPACPVCAELEAGPLASAAVRERIAQFVPVNVTASFESPDPELDRDWPYFAVLGADGLVLAELPVPASADEFVAFLDDQISTRGLDTAPSWQQVRSRAARLCAASSAPSHDVLAALAEDSSAGPFADAARSILAKRAWSARRAIVDAAAASAASGGPDAPRAILESAIERLAGTPWQADVAAVRDALVRTGRFPRLSPSPVGVAQPRR